jgi:hypothetical protein
VRTKKLKIFTWLVFRDRINSKNLKRKNYKVEGDDYICVLCNLNIEEYTYHLLFQCPFNIDCWNFHNIHWDHDLYFFDTIKAREECQHNFFMEVFSIATWEIWKQRNAKIFKAIILPFYYWRDNFFNTIRQ